MHRTYVYSQQLQVFLQQLYRRVKKIINEETPWSYRTTRVHIHQVNYPLELVLFEGPGQIGFCQPDDYVIGIHKDLAFSPSSFVDNVLRHELVHYFTGIFYPNSLTPHDQYFRQMCQQLHWELPEIENARVQEVPISPKIEKINKLLRLGESSNPHEAQLATLRAQQLLSQLQLDFFPGPELANGMDGHTFHMRKVLSFGKKSGKIRAICAIIREFYVYPVTNRCNSGSYLEITGRPENVEIAAYVVEYLDRTLEQLWAQEQKSNPQMRGIQKKNSFMAGIAAGHLAKIKAQKLPPSDHSPANAQAIVKIKAELKEAVNLVYQNLSTATNYQTLNADAQQRGMAAGKNLQIYSAINQQNRNTVLSLPESI